MSEQLNVLFLPKWYPNKFDILDGNFIENHAKAVAKIHKTVLLFVHSDASLTDKYRIEENREKGFQEVKIYFKKPNSAIPILSKILTFIAYIRAQFKGYQFYLKTNPAPDLCHIHVLSRTAPLALYLKFVKQIPFVITEHWSGYHKISGEYRGVLKKWFTRFVCAQATKISVVSTNLMQSMQRHGLKSDYSIIPNVVDTQLFKPIEKENTALKRLVHVSNLSRSPKNLHLIIKNLSELAKEHDNFEFILIGYGEEEEEMLQLIAKSNLAQRTTFLGQLSNDLVAQELAKADLTILFSKYENQPMLIIESFCCGTPVITSDVGGIPDLMNPEVGIMVEAGNNEEFKNAIAQFLTHQVEFDSLHIRNYAINNFSEEKIGNLFSTFYKNALTNG